MNSHFHLPTDMEFSVENIESVDFDIAINDDIFAQTTILRAFPRCKVYYCFKNDDTREDGEARCTQDAFDDMCRNFIANIKQHEINNPTALKCTTVVRLKDNSEITVKGSEISAEYLNNIINNLADNIDEFMLLTAFLPYI